MTKPMRTQSKPSNQPTVVMVSVKMPPETLHALRIRAGIKNLPGVSTLIRSLIDTELAKG